MKKGEFSSGEPNVFHDCTGVCAWKLSQKSSPFFFFPTTWKWGYSLLPSYPFSFCPSVSLLHIHTPRAKHAASGKKAYKLSMNFFYFNMKYCIQKSAMEKILFKCCKSLMRCFHDVSSAAIFFILKFPNLEFAVTYLWDHINTNALKWLVKCHFFTLASFVLANRFLLQLCSPSAWIKLSSSECT